MDEESTTVDDKSEQVKPENSPKKESQFEGRHVSCLKNALEKTISRVLLSGKFSRFASAYKDVYKSHPLTLKKVQKEFIDNLNKNIHEEITQIFEEEHIASLLNNLDELIDQHSNGNTTAAWRPSDIPESDLRAHLMPIKLNQRDKLKQILKEMEKENQQLANALRPRQQRLMSTNKLVNDHMQNLQQASDACSYHPDNGLMEQLMAQHDSETET